MGGINLNLIAVAKCWRPVISMALKPKQCKSTRVSYLNCKLLAACDIYGAETCSSKVRILV
jgi:hypothetical protein